MINIHLANQFVTRVQLRFLLLGQRNDPSHAGIFGYTASDIDVAGDLAESVRELYPAMG